MFPSPIHLPTSVRGQSSVSRPNSLTSDTNTPTPTTPVATGEDECQPLDLSVKAVPLYNYDPDQPLDLSVKKRPPDEPRIPVPVHVSQAKDDDVIVVNVERPRERSRGSKKHHRSQNLLASSVPTVIPTPRPAHCNQTPGTPRKPETTPQSQEHNPGTSLNRLKQLLLTTQDPVQARALARKLALYMMLKHRQQRKSQLGPQPSTAAMTQPHPAFGVRLPMIPTQPRLKCTTSSAVDIVGIPTPNLQVSTSTTAESSTIPSSFTSANPGECRNFQEQYQAYVRSKRLLSGGSTAVANAQSGSRENSGLTTGDVSALGALLSVPNAGWVSSRSGPLSNKMSGQQTLEMYTEMFLRMKTMLEHNYETPKDSNIATLPVQKTSHSSANVTRASYLSYGPPNVTVSMAGIKALDKTTTSLENSQIRLPSYSSLYPTAAPVSYEVSKCVNVTASLTTLSGGSVTIKDGRITPQGPKDNMAANIKKRNYLSALAEHLSTRGLVPQQKPAAATLTSSSVSQDTTKMLRTPVTLSNTENKYAKLKPAATNVAATLTKGEGRDPGPRPHVSPNGNHVMKPVSTEFTAWQINAYKRVPVANVNPIKQTDLDTLERITSNRDAFISAASTQLHEDAHSKSQEGVGTGSQDTESPPTSAEYPLPPKKKRKRKPLTPEKFIPIAERTPCSTSVNQDQAEHFINKETGDELPRPASPPGASVDYCEGPVADSVADDVVPVQPKVEDESEPVPTVSEKRGKKRGRKPKSGNFWSVSAERQTLIPDAQIKQELLSVGNDDEWFSPVVKNSKESDAKPVKSDPWVKRPRRTSLKQEQTASTSATGAGKKRRRKRRALWNKKGKGKRAVLHQYDDYFIAVEQVDENLVTYVGTDWPDAQGVLEKISLGAASAATAATVCTPSTSTSATCEAPGPAVDQELLTELKGICICRETGETKLHRLARMGHEHLAIRCIKANVFNINAQDYAGYTPLHECCAHGRLRVAHALIAHGADVNIAASGGIRPIHDAVDNNRIEIVRLLLSAGADFSVSTYTGKTPMKLARTDTMYRLLAGHYTDLTGMHNETTVSEPWTFTPAFLKQDDGIDLLSDAPDFDGADDIKFEMSDVQLPPRCLLNLDEKNGPKVYFLLSALAHHVNISEEDFKLTYASLHYVLVSKDKVCDELRLSNKLSESEISEAFGENNSATFVEKVKELDQILGIEDVIVRDDSVNIPKHDLLYNNGTFWREMPRHLCTYSVSSHWGLTDDQSNEHTDVGSGQSTHTATGSTHTATGSTHTTTGSSSLADHSTSPKIYGHLRKNKREKVSLKKGQQVNAEVKRKRPKKSAPRSAEVGRKPNVKDKLTSNSFPSAQPVKPKRGRPFGAKTNPNKESKQKNETKLQQHDVSVSADSSSADNFRTTPELNLVSDNSVDKTASKCPKRKSCIVKRHPVRYLDDDELDDLSVPQPSCSGVVERVNTAALNTNNCSSVAAAVDAHRALSWNLADNSGITETVFRQPPLETSKFSNKPHADTAHCSIKDAKKPDSMDDTLSDLAAITQSLSNVSVTDEVLPVLERVPTLKEFSPVHKPSNQALSGDESESRDVEEMPELTLCI